MQNGQRLNANLAGQPDGRRRAERPPLLWLPLRKRSAPRGLLDAGFQRFDGKVGLVGSEHQRGSEPDRVRPGAGNERALEKAAQGARTLETSRRIASLLAERKQLSSAAVEDLRRTLPEEAFARIENHVRTHVKRRIVIYGTKP